MALDRYSTPAVPHHCTFQHLATSGNSVNKMPPTQTLLKTLPTLAIHPGFGKVEVQSTAPHGQGWFEGYNVCARREVSLRANPRPGNIWEGVCSCLSSSGQKQGLERVKCSQNFVKRWSARCVRWKIGLEKPQGCAVVEDTPRIARGKRMGQWVIT